MQVHQLSSFADNYSHVAVCPKTNKALIIDTPDAAVILNFIKKSRVEPVAILNTHHHFDHAGGNQELCEELHIPAYASDLDGARMGGAFHPLSEGDSLQIGDLTFTLMTVPGHTLGHLALYGHGTLFCGDTLFVAGCGRLFEGTAAQMFSSLQKLKNLPDETKVYCCHEYTQANIHFALTVEPQNQSLIEKRDLVDHRRRQGLATVPTTIGDEKSYNPFLRTDSLEIRKSLQQRGEKHLGDPVQVFAALRRLKDVF